MFRQGPDTNTILVQGLYRSSDLTSYIHVLVSYVWEFMSKHQRWGLNAFSCSAVEKKNHDHVCYFFRKTLKNGGNFKIKLQLLARFWNMRTGFFFILKTMS